MKLSGTKIQNQALAKGVYTLTLFLGLIALYFATSIYRKTFIKIEFLIVVLFLAGLMTFFFIKKHYRTTYSLKGNIFPLIQGFVSGGFITCYLLLAINNYHTDQNTIEKIFDIQSKSSIKGYRYNSQRQPTIQIEYKDITKNLVFNSSQLKQIEKANKVKVKIQNGSFGFIVIRESQLMSKL